MYLIDEDSILMLLTLLLMCGVPAIVSQFLLSYSLSVLQDANASMLARLSALFLTVLSFLVLITSLFVLGVIVAGK